MQQIFGSIFHQREVATRPSIFDVDLLCNGNDKVIGICLGHAPSSAHESGIEHLAEQMGFLAKASQSSRPATDAKIKKVNYAWLRLDDFGKFVYLHYSSEVAAANERGRPLSQAGLNARLCLRSPLPGSRSNYELHTAWDRHGFLIRAMGTSRDLVQSLHTAFEKLDVAIFDRPNRQQSLSGLCFIIVSRFTTKGIDQFVRGAE